MVLDPVTVTASRTEAANSATGVSVIDWDQLRPTEMSLTIDEALRRVPGVFVQNSLNFAQDQRIAIRGFGTRAAFGVREIKLLVDGIPESSPDGQTQLDNLDLSSVRRIEVLRGPASALYGNASGGVIHLITDDFASRPYIESRLFGGSFGLQRYQARTGGRIGRLDYSLNGNWSTINGYRQHSGSENQFAGGKLRTSIDARSSLTTFFNYAHTPWSRDAGGLTRAEVDADRRQARARNVALDAGEEVRQGRLGFIYRNRLQPGHELEFMQYSLFRDFNNKLPIVPAAGDGVVEFNRIGIGGGVKYVWESEAHQLVSGVDAEFQDDDRQRYANVGGTRGAPGLDQQESVRSIGTYLRNEFRLSEEFSLIGGMRYDNVLFEVDDAFLADGDDSAARTLDQLSWFTGLEWEARTNLHLFANISTAFQTPTTTELANPTGGGGFNTALEPQTARSHELGMRNRFSDKLHAELSLFVIHIDDELVPFTSPTGRDFFRNAGCSERRGAELSMEYRWSPQWSWNTSFTAMEALYQDYVTAGGDFSGNREPGIPQHQLFTEIRWRSERGWFSSLDLQFVDKLDVNDANTARNDAYTLLNLRLGLVSRLGRAMFTPFLALNNLLNVRYNGQTRLNAFGGRFYEPSPRFNLAGGVSWRMEY